MYEGPEFDVSEEIESEDEIGPFEFLETDVFEEIESVPFEFPEYEIVDDEFVSSKQVECHNIIIVGVSGKYYLSPFDMKVTITKRIKITDIKSPKNAKKVEF